MSSAIKLLPDWLKKFAKVAEKVDNIVFSNSDTDFDNIGSGIVIFLHFNNFILDDVNFDEDDYTNIVLVRLITSCKRSKQSKACRKKIEQQLMSIAQQHSTKLWDWRMLKNKNCKRNA